MEANWKAKYVKEQMHTTEANPASVLTFCVLLAGDR
jgi:hypothetical protein